MRMREERERKKAKEGWVEGKRGGDRKEGREEGTKKKETERMGSWREEREKTVKDGGRKEGNGVGPIKWRAGGGGGE